MPPAGPAAGEAADASGAPGRRARAGHLLQVEDLLLALWILVLGEAVRRWIGDPIHLLTLGADDGRPVGAFAPPTGDTWLEYAASVPPGLWMIGGLWLFVLLTRGPEDTDRDVALTRRWPALALALPLLSIYSLIASGIQKALGLMPSVPDGQPPPWPGPSVPHWVRRTAALPLVLVGEAIFRNMGEAIEQFGPVTAPQDLLSPLPWLAILSTVFPYAIIVAGPRIAAGAELAWFPWVARFAFMHAAALAHLWSGW